MKKSMATMILCLIAASSALAAPPGPPPDPLRENFFPPELVMHEQARIGLRDDQRTQIKKETKSAQETFLDLEWKVQEEAEKLRVMLSSAKLDEGKVLEQAGRLMELEARTKKAHLTLLIRVKNVLTEEQQKKLREAMPPPMPPPPPPQNLPPPR